jgi:hypothetical protein
MTNEAIRCTNVADLQLNPWRFSSLSIQLPFEAAGSLHRTVRPHRSTPTHDGMSAPDVLRRSAILSFYQLLWSLSNMFACFSLLNKNKWLILFASGHIFSRGYEYEQQTSCVRSERPSRIWGQLACSGP